MSKLSETEKPIYKRLYDLEAQSILIVNSLLSSITLIGSASIIIILSVFKLLTLVNLSTMSFIMSGSSIILILLSCICAQYHSVNRLKQISEIIITNEYKPIKDNILAILMEVLSLVAIFIFICNLIYIIILLGH